MNKKLILIAVLGPLILMSIMLFMGFIIKENLITQDQYSNTIIIQHAQAWARGDAVVKHCYAKNDLYICDMMSNNNTPFILYCDLSHGCYLEETK